MMVNLLLIGGLSDNKFLSKTKALLENDLVKDVFLFRSNGNVYKSSKKVKVLPFCDTVFFRQVGVVRIIFDIYNLLGYSILLSHGKIDVVVGIYLYPHGYYASILGKLFNKPVILLLPGTDLKKLYETKKHLNLFLGADAIGLRGNDSIRKMVDLGFKRDKLLILNNIFNISDYNPNPHEKLLYDIIFIGYFRKLKRIDILLKVVEKLKIEFPSIRCLIMGVGPEKQYIEELTLNLGLANHVEFQNYSTSLERNLNRSKIYMLTSESEGLPMSMIEAMSCGLPAVVSNVNDIPDVVKDGYNGYLVEPLNVDMFVARCSKLLSDEKLRKQMGVNARNTIESLYQSEYSPDAVGKTWYRILEKYVT